MRIQQIENKNFKKSAPTRAERWEAWCQNEFISNSSLIRELHNMRAQHDIEIGYIIIQELTRRGVPIPGQE